MPKELEGRFIRSWRRDDSENEPATPTEPAPTTPERSAVRRLVRERTSLGSAEALATDVRGMPAARTADEPPKPSSARLEAVRDRLGKVPDEVIAAEVGVSRGIVGAYRRKHGIAAYEGYLFQVGHAPRTGKPTAPADKPGRSPPPPVASRIEEFAHLVGVVSDAGVAKRAGVSPTAVTAWRKHRGIGADNPKSSKAKRSSSARKAGHPIDAAATPATPRRSKIDAFRHLVGVETDNVVAKAAGVGREAVQMFRRRHGIAAARPRATPARAPEPEIAFEAVEPAQPAPETPVPHRTLHAYHVVFRDGDAETTYVAVGADLAEAAARVLGAGRPGAVVSLTWFAEAL
jgi:hypothetical protein